jgi:hypothetical protein
LNYRLCPPGCSCPGKAGWRATRWGSHALLSIASGRCRGCGRGSIPGSEA